MKSKNITIIMMLVTMFVLVGNPGQLKAQESDEKPSAKVKTGLTDDQFVDLMAQSVYINGKGYTEAEMEKEVLKLFKKLGITVVEFDGIMERMAEENPEHFAKLTSIGYQKGIELLKKEGIEIDYEDEGEEEDEDD